jgi:anti-sigma regulatory factor (Ser/Thr protein kinase)
VSTVLDHSPVGSGDHVVQFYETDADLVARAGRYLSDAAHDGAVAIVIATDAHHRAFESHLRDAGVDVDAAHAEGTLVSLDAAATLARFMRDGRVDRDAYFDVVGSLVRAATATGRPVRAYGEMVALLWEAGDVVAAIDLETLWNELATDVTFSLYCAYRSDSVAGHEHADALGRVCRLHSAIVPEPPVEATWQFAAELAATIDARRLLTEVLRRAGHRGQLLDDARLVITELAANAVAHARSPFTVSIRSRSSTIHIRVRDRSRAMATMRADAPTTASGRGLRLVAALSSRWGVDPVADGKVVWAVLSR